MRGMYPPGIRHAILSAINCAEGKPVMPEGRSTSALTQDEGQI